jgi:hypothetical protein
LIQAISYRRLAQRGEAQSPAIISGQCYEAVHSKSNIFARIGLSAESEQWYLLPLAWEAVVEPGENHYELTMNPATGFVERLRRLGDAPKELRQFLVQARPRQGSRLRGVIPMTMWKSPVEQPESNAAN